MGIKRVKLNYKPIIKRRSNERVKSFRKDGNSIRG